LPSLPDVVLKLDRVIADPRSRAQDVARILELDPGLAAQMLKIVNSAFFGFPREIRGLEHAVALLGIDQIRRVAFTTSVLKMFENGAHRRFDRQKFWEHSLTVAIGSRLIARAQAEREGGSGLNAEDAFLAGLLHDVGKILIAHVFGDAYERVHRMALEAHVPVEDAELRVQGVRHAEVGALLLENWGVHADIIVAVRSHHEPLSGGMLARVVHAADLVSHGLGFSADGLGFPRLEPLVWEELDFTDDVIRSIGSRVVEGIKDTHSLLGA
jgi:putative nucleotidyltransferase with HDIG domain